MPRVPRSRRAPGSLEPGRIYHVTNRGVDRCDLFQSDVDRVVFLSMVAEACITMGGICHAWCLMSNHWHLVLEDSRGLLSQTMHRIEGSYAGYFNATRSRRRTGPLFDGRYRSELIDSDEYFEEVCGYVMLNPVRTQVPMAESAEGYRWSSAAFVTGTISGRDFAHGFVASFGDVDGFLARLPPSPRMSSLELRRARVEALVGGSWFERERVLAGRTGEGYRRMLAERAGIDTAGLAEPLKRIPFERGRVGSALTHAHARRFVGFRIEEALEAVRDACARIVPATGEAVGFMLWRVTSAPLEVLAERLGMAASELEEGIRRTRRERLASPAWQRLLWAVEWRLRWTLGAAPCRG